MAINTFVSVCAEDCDGTVLYPSIEDDQSCTNFETFESQISDLYIVPTDATDPFTWATTEAITGVVGNINNSDETNGSTKWLKGEGSIDVPAKTIIEIFDFKNKTSKRRYTLQFVVKNMSYAMYEFLRAIQCGSLNFNFYYANYGGHLFGKDGGIEPAEVDVDLPQGGGRDSIEQGTITLQWEAKIDPERKINPFA